MLSLIPVNQATIPSPFYLLILFPSSNQNLLINLQDFISQFLSVFIVRTKARIRNAKSTFVSFLFAFYFGKRTLPFCASPQRFVSLALLTSTVPIKTELHELRDDDGNQKRPKREKLRNYARDRVWLKCNNRAAVAVNSKRSSHGNLPWRSFSELHNETSQKTVFEANLFVLIVSPEVT